MLEKREWKGTKNWIKDHILPSLFTRYGASVTYLKESGQWEIWLSLDYDIPAGLEQTKQGMDVDIQQEAVIAFMKEKEVHLIQKMKEYFQAVYTHEKERDYNFTVPFPPMINVKVENGVYRLQTEEEIEMTKKEFPTLVSMYENDELLLKEGYYEFVEGVSAEEIELDAFRLKRYSTIRARYEFLVPHDAIKQFDPTGLTPITEEATA